MKDNSFLNMIKKVDPDYENVQIVTTGWIDTSSYIFNALVSASIYGGMPNNRVTMLAGDPSTGKTFIALSIVKKFLEDNPTGNVIYFDTEFALDNEMIAKRGIDANRVFFQQPETLQEFRTKALQFLDNYDQMEDKPPLMIVLDSLGALPTTKEVTDSLAGSETKDMTKAQIIKSIFRVLSMRLGKNGVPLVVTNHTYDSMNMYAPKAISGGSGGLYAASTIITLSKSKDKDDDDSVIGNIIKATTYKSRFSKEQKRIEMNLNFEEGLDKYFGLLPLAEKYGIFKKTGKMFETPYGKKFQKEIIAEPEKYFTKEILDQLDEVAKREFGLGIGAKQEVVVETTED